MLPRVPYDRFVRISWFDYGPLNGRNPRRPDVNRRLLSTTSGRVYLCRVDVDHQFLGDAVRQFGSFLYEHLFDRHLDPLILVSAAFTALAFAFVPMLRLHDKRPGEPARAVGA